MKNSDRRASIWQALSQILHCRMPVMFFTLIFISLFFGSAEAAKLGLTQTTNAGQIDVHALFWFGFVSAWNLFWHAGLIIVAVILFVAAILFSTMASVMANAQATVQNEGYLGFDEPNTPSTPSGELRRSTSSITTHPGETESL